MPTIAELKSTLNNHHLLAALTPIERSAMRAQLEDLEGMEQAENETERMLYNRSHPDHEQFTNGFLAYCDENPYKVYADCRDSFDHDHNFLAAVVEAETIDSLRDLFSEKLWELEANTSDYLDRKEYYTQLTHNYFEDAPSWKALSHALDSVEHYILLDVSDAFATMLGNTTCRVTATLLDQHGEPFEAPHFENDYKAIAKRNARLLGDSYAGSDATYSESYLTVLGTIDLAQLYKDCCKPDFQLPNTITVNGYDSAVFFNSYNGSGSDLVKLQPLKARFRLRYDATRRYGVQDTYGFTGRVWDNELTLSHQVWRKNQAIKRG